MIKLTATTALARNIHQLMTEQGWEVRPLCRKAGMSHAALYNLFSGKSRSLHTDKLNAIAGVLKTTSKELLKGAELDPEKERRIPISPFEGFDALLYADCITMIREIYLTENINASLNKKEYREFIMKKAAILHKHAVKKGLTVPERIAAEVLIEGETQYKDVCKAAMDPPGNKEP